MLALLGEVDVARKFLQSVTSHFMRASRFSFWKDSYILHLQRKWAEPNGVDVVLILPDDTTAALRANRQP